jgi:essential nuclear protein 1
MPKATASLAEARQARRHNPLEDDLLATGPLRTKPAKRKSGRDEEDEDKFVDSKASRKILRIGQELAEEEAESQAVAKPNNAFDFESRFEDDEDQGATFDDDEAWGDEDDIVEEVELDPEDLETFSKFFPTQEDPLLRQGWGGTANDEDEGPGTNLADLILEKIAAHEAAQAGQGGVGQGMSGMAPEEDYELPPKVVEVYTKYIPKVLPSMPTTNPPM